MKQSRDAQTGDLSSAAILRGAFVVDFSLGIAGGYATRLLAYAGADVLKIEPPSRTPQAGDPLRWRSATGAADPVASPLFRFLHHGKRFVHGTPHDADIRDALKVANVVILDRETDMEPADLLAEAPHAVVLSLTPYGRIGPAAAFPASDLTLQAECGSLAMRAHAKDPPVMAGGETAEWIAGVYGAFAVAAARRRAAQSGHGELIDLSVAEAMHIAAANFNDLLHYLQGRPPITTPARVVETPEIHPTADGFVGFTTNSRQQFLDFLILIERADLLEDDELATARGRQARYDEWTQTVEQWTRQRTTDSIVEAAADLRIPCAPVNDAAHVLSFDHFTQRGVFAADPSGVDMPRRPWLINGESAPPPGGCGLPDDAATAAAPSEPSNARPTQDPRLLPLSGVRVVDLTAWWAGPTAAHLLGTLGADVLHIESTRRPDGMRMVGGGTFPGSPDWWERSHFFLACNTNKRGVTLDLSQPRARELALDLVAKSDVVIENFSPRVLTQLGLEFEKLKEANPRVVLVRMPAFGLTGPWADRGGFAQTMEQLSGLAWLTGHAYDRPHNQRGPCDPNAGAHAAFAALVALEERDRTGAPQHVEVPMIESALNIAAGALVEFSATGVSPGRDGNRSPGCAPQGVYACKGQEEWLAISVQHDEQWEGLRRALDYPAWASDPALASYAGRHALQDELDSELGASCIHRDALETAERLRAHGVPAAVMLDPRISSTHAQFADRGFFELVDHSVVGVHPVPTMPFRFASVERWIRSPAPTLGEHTRAVLSDLAAVSAAELDRLERDGVIGTSFAT